MSENILIRFDWVIKNMLRDKSNYCILEGFLSALLKENITVLEILESESNQEDIDNKFNRVDILVKDNQEHKIIVEVQNSYENDFLERLLYGVSKTIVEYMKIGESYHKITKVISVSIQYFNMGMGSDYIYQTITKTFGIHNNEELIIRKRYNTNIDNKESIKLKVKDIFPEYYFISIDRFDEKIKDDIDEWIYMMKNNKIEPSFKSKNIQKAGEKLDILKMDKEERKKYDKYLDSVQYEKAVIKTALEKGREKGKEEGREEGEKNGIIKMVKEMIKNKIPIAQIILCSNFSIEEIEKLRKEI